MKLCDLNCVNVLARPLVNNRTVAEGLCNGRITNAELQERESKYTDDKTRVVLNMKIEVVDKNGEAADLYLASNYSWSKKGNMVKVLENLQALPAPGKSIAVEDLVGIPVQVMVENVIKDDETYSNIVSIKRISKVSSDSKSGTNLMKGRRKSQTESRNPFEENEYKGHSEWNRTTNQPPTEDDDIDIDYDDEEIVWVEEDDLEEMD